MDRMRAALLAFSGLNNGFYPSWALHSVGGVAGPALQRYCPTWDREKCSMGFHVSQRSL